MLFRSEAASWAGEERRLAAAVQAVQVTSVRHAIQDGSSGSGHAPILSLFNILCKAVRAVTPGQRRAVPEPRPGQASRGTAGPQVHTLLPAMTDYARNHAQLPQVRVPSPEI